MSKCGCTSESQATKSAPGIPKSYASTGAVVNLKTLAATHQVLVKDLHWELKHGWLIHSRLFEGREQEHIATNSNATKSADDEEEGGGGELGS